jgi:hypothetical protein
MWTCDENRSMGFDIVAPSEDQSERPGVGILAMVSLEQDLVMAE